VTIVFAPATTNINYNDKLNENRRLSYTGKKGYNGSGFSIAV